jgi:HAD superfamily hydrolase (TIGR01509 family)
MTIEAVIFDFDGLILDTESHEFYAHAEIYRRLGVELPLKVWGKVIGTDSSAFDVYAYLEELVGHAVDRNQLRIDKNLLFQQRMSEEHIRPGVLDYLQQTKALGLRIGLASSSPRIWVAGYLEQYDLMPYFETIRTADDVEKVKPDPALYIKALADLNVHPSKAIAFEDSPNGALAAKRAGMHCVIVPNSVTKDLQFGTVDLRIDSMEQMSLAQILAYF